jgi:hypothetical protein
MKTTIQLMFLNYDVSNSYTDVSIVSVTKR